VLMRHYHEDVLKHDVGDTDGNSDTHDNLVTSTVMSWMFGLIVQSAPFK
jgi:hypothetical protein